MTTRVVPGELLAFLTAAQAPENPLREWLNTSPRFAAFAHEHREKIRKKLRSADGAEGAHDVLSELETAYALLREPRIAVEYETHAHRQARGPDFSLTWRTHTLCHVEAARLRALAPAGERLHELICSKLGQMLPSALNVLVIATSAALPAPAELAGALKQLQARAEQEDARVLARYHFDGRAGFFKYYTRLSAIVLRNGWDAAAPGAPTLCPNKQARWELPDNLAHALHTTFTPEAPGA